MSTILGKILVIEDSEEGGAAWKGFGSGILGVRALVEALWHSPF